MKNVFISSVIKDFESYREAAKKAVELMRYKPIMSESFGARHYSSEIACITEVEKSDVYLLILGEKYGFETADGLSVTQSEFRVAQASASTILVFIQDIVMEHKQQELKNEVEHYHDGFYRASFSSPGELKDEIIKGLRQLEQTENTIPESEFEKNILDKIEQSHGSYYGRDAELILAFFPQPKRERDLDGVEQSLNETFQKLFTSHVAELSDGYEKISDRNHAGLQTGKLSVYYYDDGSILLRADPTIDGIGSFSTNFASPTKIAKYCNAFQQLVPENSGFMRIELRNMENMYVAEPPDTNSLSMAMYHQESYAINKLFIPLTEAGYAVWVESCIKRLKRQYKFEEPQRTW